MLFDSREDKIKFQHSANKHSVKTCLGVINVGNMFKACELWNTESGNQMSSVPVLAGTLVGDSIVVDIAAVAVPNATVERKY